MPEPTRVRRRPDATTAHRRTARLVVLDAITADVEAGLVQLSLSTDDPEDTEPCREALRMRLCRLRDAASTLRLALLTPRPCEEPAVSQVNLRSDGRNDR